MKLPFLKKKQPARPAPAPETAAPPAPRDPVADFLRRHGQAPEQLELDALTEAFAAAMRAGLRGEAGGLPMLPAYLTPRQRVAQHAPVAVLDAGGTHLRAGLVTFLDGAPLLERTQTRPMPGADGAAAWADFLRAAADLLEPLLDGVTRVGVCFSYPAEITPELDARVLRTTKELRLDGCVGRLVCADLAAELRRRGFAGLRLAALNDTVAAYLYGRVCICNKHTNGFLGMVSGTGTNTACALPAREIPKLGRPDDETPMLVNLESGSFTGVPQGDYDRALDAASDEPGAYLFEKMTGGRYLGELCRLTLRGAAQEGLFTPETAARLLALETLSTPDAGAFAEALDPGDTEETSVFVGGRQIAWTGLGGDGADGAGAPFVAPDVIGALADAPQDDCETAARLIRAVFQRAARAIAANLAAILELTGGADNRFKPLAVCVDGALFAGSALLREAVGAAVQSYLADQRRRYCVCKSVTNATRIGAAAAVLLTEPEPEV